TRVPGRSRSGALAGGLPRRPLLLLAQRGAERLALGGAGDAALDEVGDVQAESGLDRVEHAAQRTGGLAGELLAGHVAVGAAGADHGDLADLGVALREGLHEGGQLVHDALGEQRLLVLAQGLGLGAHRIRLGLTGQALGLGIGLGALLDRAGIGGGARRAGLALTALLGGGLLQEDFLAGLLTGERLGLFGLCLGAAHLGLGVRAVRVQRLLLDEVLLLVADAFLGHRTLGVGLADLGRLALRLDLRRAEGLD